MATTKNKRTEALSLAEARELFAAGFRTVREASEYPGYYQVAGTKNPNVYYWVYSPQEVPQTVQAIERLKVRAWLRDQGMK